MTDILTRLDAMALDHRFGVDFTATMREAAAALRRLAPAAPVTNDAQREAGTAAESDRDWVLRQLAKLREISEGEHRVENHRKGCIGATIDNIVRALKDRAAPPPPAPAAPVTELREWAVSQREHGGFTWKESMGYLIEKIDRLLAAPASPRKAASAPTPAADADVLQEFVKEFDSWVGPAVSNWWRAVRELARAEIARRQSS